MAVMKRAGRADSRSPEPSQKCCGTGSRPGNCAAATGPQQRKTRLRTQKSRPGKRPAGSMEGIRTEGQP